MLFMFSVTRTWVRKKKTDYFVLGIQINEITNEIIKRGFKVNNLTPLH